MCKLINKTELKTFTGYKLLAYKNGIYYSSFTGEEFRLGVVPPPPNRCKPLSHFWNSSLHYFPLNELAFYKLEYVGKTGVFIDIFELIECFQKEKFKQNVEIIPVKITISGEIWEGTYRDKTVYCGTEVLKIERI